LAYSLPVIGSSFIEIFMVGSLKHSARVTFHSGIQGHPRSLILVPVEAHM